MNYYVSFLCRLFIIVNFLLCCGVRTINFPVQFKTANDVEFKLFQNSTITTLLYANKSITLNTKYRYTKGFFIDSGTRIRKNTDENDLVDFVSDENNAGNFKIKNGILKNTRDNLSSNTETGMPCKENALYHSLDMCITMCENRNNSSDIFHTIMNTSTDYQYKVILLRKHNFFLYQNFNTTSYVFENDTAFVCFPLDEQFISCRKWLLNKDEYVISEDGKLWVHPYKRTYKLGEYYYLNGQLAVCIHDEKNKLDIFRVFHIVGYAISVLCLVVTFVMSFIDSGLKQRSNRPLQCHMSMLLFGYVVLVLKHAIYRKIGMGIACIILPCLQQFFFLSAFFWINSQAFDLYIALKDLRPNHDAMKRRQRRFIFYCMYSWGIPGIITLSTISAEVGHFSRTTDPQFQMHCWFQIANQMSAFLYYYGWMAIILVMNIILFLLIVRKFHVMGQEVFIANKNIHKQLFRISIKLVIVMGIFWVVKVIIWALGYIDVITSILDTFSALQGFFVFLVYLCKKEKMKSWYPCRICNESSTTDYISESDSRPNVLSSFVLFATLNKDDEFTLTVPENILIKK